MKNKKVLFLKFSSLGDVIISNYYAKKIKYKHPDWHMVWLVDSMYRDIVKSQPWIDDVMTWNRQKEGNRGFVKAIMEVRSKGFDVLIDMHNTDRSSIFSFFSNVSQRFSDRYRLPLAHTVHSFDSLYDNTDEISACPKYLYAPPIADRIKSMLYQQNDEMIITAAIGASYEKKRWPVKNWIVFCKTAAISGYSLYLTGNGPEEEKNARIIADSVGNNNLKNLVGKLSITELVQVIDNSCVTVSGDTGAIHIARALGKKTIAMFGPSSISDVSYVESLKNVFYCDCPDKGCHNFECSKPCMDTISPIDVYDCLSNLK